MPRDYKTEMEQDLQNIEKLISIPQFIQETAIDALEKILIEEKDLLNTTKIKIRNTSQALKNISNGSIQQSFSIIYNQVCVLSVSTLNAKIEDYFINYIASGAWKDLRNINKIKLTLAELSDYKFQIIAPLGKIILAKDNSINFQDLQSTIRTFNDYLGKDINIEENLKKQIIFYQQCRHVLVHKNGIIDDEFLNKVGSNNLKNYTLGQQIKLDNEDWLKIKKIFPEIIRIINSAKTM
jgi:hypothetical protein